MTTATYRARAFLEAAGRLDLPIAVGSERKQSLSAANPAGHLTLDFQEPEASSAKIQEFAERFPVHAIVATDDAGVLPAAAASLALGLPHNPVDAVEATRNKLLMRQALSESGMLSPAFWYFESEEDPEQAAREVTWPCVLKPLFLSGSRGVIRADNREEFVEAFQRVVAILCRSDVAAMGGPLARRVLVEEFIPGAELALEGLLTDGKLKVLAINDKPDPLEGPYFEETIYVTPSRHPLEVQEKISECVQEAVGNLGLRHGPIHAELRLNERGPWVLEIAPRSIGGLCSRTLRFGEGISLEELILRHALGFEVDSLEREDRAAGVMMIPVPQGGVLQGVQGREEAETVAGIEEILISIPIGQKLVPLPEGDRYLGFIFARGQTPEEVEAALRKAHTRLHFTIGGAPGQP